MKNDILLSFSQEPKIGFYHESGESSHIVEPHFSKKHFNIILPPKTLVWLLNFFLQGIEKNCIGLYVSSYQWVLHTYPVNLTFLH